MVDDEEQEELRCTGSDVEIEEYTDTEDSPYVAYQATDKLFDTDRATWQKFSFIATLLTVVVSITFLIITYPLYLESVSYVSNAYTGDISENRQAMMNLSSLAQAILSCSFFFFLSSFIVIFSTCILIFQIIHLTWYIYIYLPRYYRWKLVCNIDRDYLIQLSIRVYTILRCVLMRNVDCEFL